MRPCAQMARWDRHRRTRPRTTSWRDRSGNAGAQIPARTWTRARCPGTTSHGSRRRCPGLLPERCGSSVGGVGGRTTRTSSMEATGGTGAASPRPEGSSPGPWRLELDGLATVADAWLNGEHLLHSENMWVAHQLPVDHLDPGNVLLLRFSALSPLLAQRRPRPRWRSLQLRSQNQRWYRTTLLGRVPGWAACGAPVGPWRPVRLPRRGATVRGRTPRDGALRGSGRDRRRPFAPRGGRRRDGGRARRRGGAPEGRRLRSRRGHVRRGHHPGRRRRTVVAAHTRRPTALSRPPERRRRRPGCGNRRLPDGRGRPGGRRLQPLGERRSHLLPGRVLDAPRRGDPALDRSGAAGVPPTGRRRRHEHDPDRRLRLLRGRALLGPVRRAGNPRVAGLHAGRLRSARGTRVRGEPARRAAPNSSARSRAAPP